MISLVDVYEKVRKSFISVCKKAQQGQQMHLMAVKTFNKTFWFCDFFFFWKKIRRHCIWSNLNGCRFEKGLPFVNILKGYFSVKNVI